VDSAIRILLISQGFPKYAGDSTAPFMEPIVKTLAARGHLVDVVLPYHPLFHYPAGSGYEFFPYKYSPVDRIAPWGFGNSLTGSSRVSRLALLMLPSAIVSLRRRLGSLKATRSYDVVHAHWLLPNAWVAAAARGPTVPLVVTLHGSDLAIAERTRLMGRMARRAFSAAGAVTAVSDDLRRRAEQLGANPATTRTVHLGVDTRTFAPRNIEHRVRSRLGAHADALLVVAVGRLVEKKGLRYLVEAVSQLDGVHLAIVGDGDLRGELETLAHSQGASVTFTGNLDRLGVSEAVATADVVAVPSVVDATGNVDGLPTTLLEALSSARPVVASAIAGIPEVVRDRVNGLLVQERDVDGLAGAIAELRDHPELRDELGAEARRLALEELDWNSTAAAFEHAYALAGASS
jgi:glycosyltransferase involved in cell wall biosynthesis